MIIVNGWKLMASAYHKAVHLGCCSSPRSASVVVLFTTNFKFFVAIHGKRLLTVIVTKAIFISTVLVIIFWNLAIF